MGITPLISSQEKMVKISVTLLTVASVFLTATRPVNCDLAEIETLTKCMAGTKLEAMLKEGMGKCSGAPPSSWDGCPTYEQGLSHVETVHSDEACVLRSLGWVDAENNLKKAVILQDVASLPKDVAHFDVVSFKNCVTEQTSELNSSICVGNFTGEELATLTKAIIRMVRYHCIVHRLTVSCSNTKNFPGKEAVRMDY